MSRYVTGTLAQLSGKLTLNGVKLDTIELATMTRVFKGSIFKQVGSVKKDGRGRPAIVWCVDTESAAWFECADETDLKLSDDAPENENEIEAKVA